jgi:hypothetical protein
LVPLPEHGGGDHGAEVARAAGDEDLHVLPFPKLSDGLVPGL